MVTAAAGLHLLPLQPRLPDSLRPLVWRPPTSPLRSPSVGAGGHILGGGQGNLVRAYGQACDRLRALEMVDAAGRLVRADAKTNPELLWAACGGGGGNLGIVTTFELEPVDVPAVVSHVEIEAPEGESAADFVAWFFSTYSRGLPRSTSPFLTWLPSGALVTGINLAPKKETQAMLEAQGLGEAPPGTNATVREMSWLDTALASAGEMCGMHWSGVGL